MTDAPATVAVIGGGKMGLPLAATFADAGARVTVADINDSLVATINRGAAPFEEPGLAELLERVVGSGSLRATTDTAAAVSASDVIVVIVPVLLTPDRDADLAVIESVARTIGAAVRPGAMVAFETTLPVGTTRRLGELIDAGGSADGRFDLVFSPERVKSRLVLKRLRETPKIVGGLTPEAAARGEAFYRTHLGVEVHNVGTLEAAEFAKLAGMVYRDVNIALANELARYAENVGLDFAPVRSAANTDGESALLMPGIGVGGHCTPIYPYFLLRDAERRQIPAALTAAGRAVNDLQPVAAIDRVEAGCGSLAGKRVHILGLAFRPGVKEHIASPAFALRDELVRRGARPTISDPLYGEDEVRANGFEPAEPHGAEIVILNTAHPAFRSLLRELAAGGTRLVFDGRRAWSPDEAKRLGLTYLGIGLGGD